MSFIWDEQAAGLLQDEGAFKVLAANDRHGNPHMVVDHTIALDESGNIIYLDLLETSEMNSNLVHSIWFKRQVAVHVAKGGAAYQIKGVPVRSVISGPLFEHYYRLAQERDAAADLSTVWIIEPQEISNEAIAFRRQQERDNHPLTMHLDRLAK
ncbi:MAG: hypothetical protein K0R57_4636 [Paenibacillaceae bacterium]|nr:hypothetical protein [Paenibacillaceae bacterium]